MDLRQKYFDSKAVTEDDTATARNKRIANRVINEMKSPSRLDSD